MSQVNYLLSSNITFNDTEKRMQAVYASQNYGTFYTVYANFEFNKEDILEKINFFTINYRGETNMGFIGENSSDNKIEFIMDGDVLKIVLSMKGNSKYDSTICTIVKNDIKKDDITGIYIYRELHEMHSDYSTNSNLGTFDSEFYDRKSFGSTKPKNPIPYGLKGYIGEKFPDTPQKTLDLKDIKVGIAAFSGNCQTSLLKVV